MDAIPIEGGLVGASMDKTQPTTLPKFPAEILLKIAGFLSPESVVLFSFCSRSIYRTVGSAGRATLKSLAEEKTQADTYDGLKLLARELPDFIACYHCKMLHGISTAKEHLISWRKRGNVSYLSSCAASDSQDGTSIHFHDGFSSTIGLMTMKLHRQGRDCSELLDLLSGRPRNQTSPIGSSNIQHYQGLAGIVAGSLLIRQEVVTMLPVMSKHELEISKHGLKIPHGDIRICPHARFNYSRVLDAYRRTFSKLQGDTQQHSFGNGRRGRDLRRSNQERMQLIRAQDRINRENRERERERLIEQGRTNETRERFEGYIEWGIRDDRKFFQQNIASDDDHNEDPEQPMAGQFVQCQDCLTERQISYRYNMHASTEVWVTRWKNLGAMESVEDPLWRAQIGLKDGRQSLAHMGLAAGSVRSAFEEQLESSLKFKPLLNSDRPLDFAKAGFSRYDDVRGES
jgi:hypothetical protein